MFPDLSMLPPEVQQQIQQAEQQIKAQLQQLDETVTVEKIEALLRDQKMRPFALDIETDSTIEPDQQAEKMARTELTSALGPFLAQSLGALGMAGSVAPQLGKFFAETLRYIASGFKVARSMDDAIDELAEGMENFQPPQEPQGEDPASAQMEAQASMIKAQADAQKAQNEAQAAQGEMQFKVQEMQLEAQKTGVEIEKLYAEIEKIRAETASKAEEMDIRKAEVALKGHEVNLNAKKTDADIQRGDRELSLNERKTSGELTLAERKLQADAQRGERQDGLAAKKVDNDREAAGLPAERTKKKRVLTPEHDDKGRIKRVVETEED
jgi:hypothetical protein